MEPQLSVKVGRMTAKKYSSVPAEFPAESYGQSLLMISAALQEMRAAEKDCYATRIRIANPSDCDAQE